MWVNYASLGGYKMSRQLPNRQVPLLQDGENRYIVPKRRRISLTTILGFTFMLGLICSILLVGVLLVFPEAVSYLRAMAGLPVSTQQASPIDAGNIELTVQAVIGMTQTVLPNNSIGSTTVFTATPYPTYTPLQPLPTYTFPAALPTYTPYPTYTIYPTYTPYPSPEPGIGIPLLATATSTIRANLIFEDNFDAVIDTGRWQLFGSWIIGKDDSNGYPLLFEPYKPNNDNNWNAFHYGNSNRTAGGLLFPGASQMDDIALEFDKNHRHGMAIFLSYQDELNYKLISISPSITSRLVGSMGFMFVSNGELTTIPQSSVEIPFKGDIDHFRIEIRRNALTVYANSDLLYDVRDLPANVTGIVGFATEYKDFVFDDFKIYQLP